MIIKSRTNDPNAFPQGQTLTGLYGKDPVAGYFFANPVPMRCQRDDYGVVQKWEQDNDKGKQEFDPQDVCHFYYKREKGRERRVHKLGRHKPKNRLNKFY